MRWWSLLSLCLILARYPVSAALFSDFFSRTDGLITNEYGYWNPNDSRAITSPDWAMTSGSLFAQGQAAWSGIPDNCSGTSLNATSSTCTNSAVFRLHTKRFDFNNVKVAFRLLSNGLSSTASTPAVAWDGIHIFLRYQSQYQLYYASINRRDGKSVLKKKCEGGTDNGGTYYDLSPFVSHPWTPGTWQHITATIQTNADNTVTIALYDDKGLVVQATDTHIGKCAPITAPGAFGIRGDNNNFKIDDFEITDLSAPTPTPTPTHPLPVVTSLSPTSVTAGASVFSLTVTGSGFVAGSQVLWNGQALPTVYKSATQLETSVSAALVGSAGSATVAVVSPTPGGGTSAAKTFTIQPPPIVTNPLPTVSGLSPASAVVGTASLHVTVQGSNFEDGSIIRWNGQDRTTTFVSATQLRMTATAADLDQAGTAVVTVYTPGPGGGTSNGSVFTITTSPSVNPVPRVTVLNPSSALAGGSGFTLVITGGSFVPGSTVRWDGADLPTSYVSQTEIQALVNQAQVSTQKDVQVTVENPTPGGGISNAIVFAVLKARGSLRIKKLQTSPVMTVDSVVTASAEGASVLHWTLTPEAAISSSRGLLGVSASGIGVRHVSTQSPALSLGPLQLIPGPYTIEVTAEDETGNISDAVSAAVTLVAPNLNEVRVFPNPWRKDRHGTFPVTFDNLSANSEVKIFTISGHQIKTLPKADSSITWDLSTDGTEDVASGVYLFEISDGSGGRRRGKLAVIH